jgi:hypothetical protein
VLQSAPSEEPRSQLPWTPSYSVSTQGSNSTNALATTDADSAEVSSENVPVSQDDELVEEGHAAVQPADQEQAVEDAVPAHEAEIPDGTPINSEQQQVAQDTVLTAEGGLVDETAPSAEQSQRAEDDVGVAEDAAPVPPTIQVSDAAKEGEDVEKASEDTATVERPPSRPWTPSYSVTNQGLSTEPDALVEDDEEDFMPPVPLPSLKVRVTLRIEFMQLIDTI